MNNQPAKIAWESELAKLENYFYQFDFFQLNMVLQYIKKQAELDRVKINIVFHSFWRQIFSASDVVDLQYSKENQTIDVTVAFLSLGGPNGLLPQPYIDFVISESRSGNRALQGFFDIFHHELLNSLVDIQHRFSFQIPYLDHSSFVEKKSLSFLDYLSHFNGLGACIDLHRMDWMSFFSVTDLPLMDGSINSFKGFIANIFGEEGTITEQIGHWNNMPQSFQNKMGKRNSVLGENFYLGRKIWINNHAITISIDVTFQYHLTQRCRNVHFIKKFLEVLRIYADDLSLRITLFLYVTDLKGSSIILNSRAGKMRENKTQDKQVVSDDLSEFFYQNNILGVNTYFKDKFNRFILRYVTCLLL